MTPSCPVCHRALIHTVDGIWSCPPRKIKFPSLGTVLEMRHAVLFYDKEHCTYKNIIAGEYSFKIWDQPDKKLTEIFVLKKKDYYRKSKINTYEWEKILEISKAATLPWGNPAKVADRVKTYLIFS